MRDRRRLLALFTVTVLAVSVVGTGGFSTTSADRSVTVDVVGDENASMALEYPVDASAGTAPTTVTFLEVTNQFTQSVDVTVEPDVDTDADLDASVSSPGDPDFRPGESAAGTVQFTCGENASESESATVTFDVTADGDTVYAETAESRSVDYTVQCASDEAQSSTAENETTETSTGTPTETTAE